MSHQILDTKFYFSIIYMAEVTIFFNIHVTGVRRRRLSFTAPCGYAMAVVKVR